MENLKKYIKENKNIEKFYYNGLKEKTIEQKYQYIKNHFQYDIMNSWNNLKTFANNVKIYELGFTNDLQNKFFELMQIDPDYYFMSIDWIIKDFETLTNTDIYFNGRSGGYIVVTPKFDIVGRNEHIAAYYGVEDILYFDNYKDFKHEQNEYTGSYNYSYKNEIENMYYFLKAFDKLCDILRNELLYILNNYEIEETEETKTEIIKKIVI